MVSPSSDSSLGGNLRFHVYAALVALAAAVVLTVLFWRLYKLTVCARPRETIPVSSSCADAGGKGPLRQRDVAALPVFVHASAAGGGEAIVECAVCLAEMRDGERGRLLPGCGHRFHVDCIDRWFRANSTCPICRAAAVVGRRPGEVEPCKDGSASVTVVVQH